MDHYYKSSASQDIYRIKWSVPINIGIKRRIRNRLRQELVLHYYLNSLVKKVMSARVYFIQNQSYIYKKIQINIKYKDWDPCVVLIFGLKNIVTNTKI